MTEKKGFDLVVLGGGPGGYTAAFRAADLGLSVCLVEQYRQLGGVCLYVGCIPSKTLVHCVAVTDEVKAAADFGLKFGPLEFDINALRNKKDQVIGQLADGLDRLCKARKVERLEGRGEFLDAKTLVVSADNGETEVTFKNAIIATGSHVTPLPNTPEDARIWTSTEALALPFIPKRLLVVGGGNIGLEISQVYFSLGSKVTIIEMRDQLIPQADRDLVQPLFQKLKKMYDIRLKTKVDRMTARDNGIEVTFSGEEKEETGEYDAVLIAIGRRPSSKGFGLEKVGLDVDEGGFIKVNERQQTSVDHFFAIGDVVGEPMLAHKATHQGKVAAEVIAGRKSAFTPMTIPSVSYTSPEVAWMGVTEREAKERGLDYLKGKFPWAASGRALCSGATNGVSKVLFDKKTGRIIGAGICGLNAGELIHEAMVAMEMGADAEDISKTVHAHPTLSETFALAAEIVDGSITDILPSEKKSGKSERKGEAGG